MSNQLERLPTSVGFTLIDETAEPTPGVSHEANVGRLHADQGYVTFTTMARTSEAAAKLEDSLIMASQSDSTFVHVSVGTRGLTEPSVLRVIPGTVMSSETSMSIGSHRSEPTWLVVFSLALEASQH